jgi:hypothetical protein
MGVSTLSDKEQENHDTEPPRDSDSVEQNLQEVAGAMIWFGPLYSPDTLEYLSDLEPGEPAVIRRNDPNTTASRTKS